MYSNGYRTSFLNSPTEIHRRSQMATHTYPSLTPETEQNSLLLLKVDMLTKKLRRNKPVSNGIVRQNLEHSGYSQLKSTKCPQAMKQDTQYDWSHSDLNIKREAAVLQSEIDLLEEQTVQISGKIKEIRQYFSLHSHQLEGSVDQLHHIIRELQQRTNSCHPLRKEYCLYTDLFQPRKDRESPSLKKTNTRKPTLSSAGKDASLLLSFKKNIEEEDGYMTLKYSQQSMSREPNDTLVEGWQSFRRENRSRLRKKGQIKGVKDSEIIREQIQEEYFEAVKEEVTSHLSLLKNNLTASAIQNSRVFCKFEGFLDEIVEQIAEEKVQREHEWKDLKKQLSEGVVQASQRIGQLKTEAVSYQLQIDEKLADIEREFGDMLSREASERKLEERLMIRMMLDVVQFLK